MKNLRYFCPPKYCYDRTIEDILPADIIEQIELDPEESYTPGENKNNNLEFYREVSETNIETKRETQIYNPITITKKTIEHYKVQIENEIVNALCLFDCMQRDSDFVIVRGGKYVQSGKIIQNLSSPEKIETSFQIIAIDHNGLLHSYLEQQKKRAFNLSKVLIKKYDIQTNIVNCFAVCGRVRGLLRIQVTNSNAPNIDFLIHDLIQLFCCSIEIYESE
ncbi:hypothetical protein TVAG_268780 [Trichomonas vaginalis G3]|uniref:Uncharacterized protein n=1 Tax=Trichomonas vaginalis (strain ATCC PRA-98 / G3) TaxID=412133 RepID=A2FIW4_TRIV3|nr:hypothetical protein TVAGG3_0473360 [Trichomonas vaginalis G3]EAX95141.1 hypothetical protein TVAG_268780 [Trichomonas vaginalis G3]KAI5515232.1 hypothetical protein TVAGG3_0473360 [Trichomonas vaginalis G3]|eukprot:XP_001308071.1 hypothetical protein [Trichomonas vaginalis G3]